MSSQILIILALGGVALYAVYRIFKPQKAYSSSAHQDALEEGQITDLKCTRCMDSKMIYNGMERFHVGSNSAPFIFGNLGELFVNKQTFDIYYCPICGKVEFFFRKKES